MKTKSEYQVPVMSVVCVASANMILSGSGGAKGVGIGDPIDGGAGD